MVFKWSTHRLLKLPLIIGFTLWLIPFFVVSQDLGKQLLGTLGNRAKRGAADYASKKLSKEVAKVLGFSPLLTLSRGDRSMSGQQKRNAESAYNIFVNRWQTTPAMDHTRVSKSPITPVTHPYDQLTEADIHTIQEAFKPQLDRIRQAIDHPRTPGTVPVYPHQKRLINLQAYCLDKGIASPQTQEAMQLVPLSGLLPEDAYPYYRSLLQYGQSTGRNDEVQGLIWRLVHGVNPEHPPTPLAPNEKAILDEAVPGGSAGFYGYLQGKYDHSKNSLEALYQSQGRELVQNTINRYVNPVFAQEGMGGIQVSLYRQDLNSPVEIRDYLNQLTQMPITGVRETYSEYTLLSDQVAARSQSTNQYHAMSVEVLNQSDQVYYYDPLQHIGFSTRMTQPLGHYPKTPEDEDDPETTGRIAELLQFLKDHPEYLDYAGYTLDGLLLFTGIGEVYDLAVAARLIARNPGKLRELWEIFMKAVGKKEAGTALEGAFINGWTKDKILSFGWGNRPNPSSYLNKEYIDKFLGQFGGGVTRFQKVKPGPMDVIGDESGVFVLPKSKADELISESGGDIGKLEELLGLPRGHLGESPIRIDVSKPGGLRVPSGNEIGANNQQWIPGGYTSGGVPEAVINRIRPDTYTLKPVFK